MIISRFLKPNSRLYNNKLMILRHVHKGCEGAPPMRYLSPANQITRFLILVVSMLSYPTYVLYNLDHIRPRPDNALSEEMQEVLAKRKALRAENKQPILQEWPAIKQNQSE